MENTFVISLGGSVFVPQVVVDTGYLRRFRLFFKKQINKGNKFILVAGGGGVAREYQGAAKKIGQASKADLDWVGIYSTLLNAQLLRAIFSKEAEPIIFDQRFKFKKFGQKPLIAAGGWQPGWSTDFVATQIAADMKIKRVINLTNLAFVYTGDPKKDKAAKPIKEINWKDYFKVICPKWSSGMHSPFDPVASKLAQKNGIEVIVASGKDLANAAKIINGQKFRGTIISDN